MGEGFFEVFDGGEAGGVVGGGGGAAESLAQDPGAGAVAEGVVGCGEEGGLELWEGPRGGRAVSEEGMRGGSEVGRGGRRRYLH